MANEFVIKNGFFSQGASNVTGNLTVTQTVSGTTGQFTNLTASVVSGTSVFGTTANFNQITASFVNFLNVTGTYSGNGALLTNVTASALNDTTGTFSFQNIQDGQYLKRSGNTIIGTFMLAIVAYGSELDSASTIGTTNDNFTNLYTFTGTAA
jgi:hypothetical protein